METVYMTTPRRASRSPARLWRKRPIGLWRKRHARLYRKRPIASLVAVAVGVSVVLTLAGCGGGSPPAKQT